MIVDLITTTDRALLPGTVPVVPRKVRLLMVSETDFKTRDGWVDMFRRFDVLWEAPR